MTLLKTLVSKTKLLFRRPSQQEYAESNFHKEDEKFAKQKDAFYSESNFFSRWFYNFMNPILEVGARRSLNREDVPQIPPEIMKPQEIAEKFWRNLRHSKYYTSSSSSAASSASSYLSRLGQKYFMIRALSAVLFKEFMVAAIPKLFADFFTLMSSLILREMLLYVEAKNAVSNSLWYALFMCFLFFMDKALQTMCEENHWYRIRILVEKVQTTLTYGVYHKSLLLSSSAKQEYSTGECINLLSNDVSRLKEIMFDLHQIWINVIRITASLAMVTWLMGFLPMLASLLVIVLILPFNYLFLKKTEDYVAVMDETQDKRVKTVQEVVSSIRVLKLFSWEKLFLEKVDQHRKKELDCNKNSQRLNIYSVVFWAISQPFMTFAAFFTYAYALDQNITISLAFAAVSIFGGLTWSLFIIPRTAISIIAVKSSVTRLQKFFSLEELTPVEGSALTDSIVEMNDATFTWAEQSSPQLCNITFKAKPGSFVAVVGATGSGKTSLASCILGEMKPVSGELTVNAKQIAYVSQKPWIQSATLRENILFGLPYEKQRYDAVVEACCLVEDIKQMPAGDMSEIGEKGINLSGGQRARVNLARALYSDSDLILLDDVLAAVDAVVGKHLLENALLTYLKGKTRILITHHLHFLQQVDHIVVMRNGAIAEQGTYDHLIANEEGILKQLIQEHTVAHAQDEQHLDSTIDKEPETKKRAAEEPSEELEDAVEASGAFVEHDKKEEGEIGWHCVKDFLTIYSFKLVLLMVILVFVRNSFDIFNEVWLSYWGKDEGHKLHSVSFYTMIYGAAGVAKGLLSFVVAFLSTIFFVNTGRAYHARLLNSIIHATLEFFDKTPSGRIVSRFSSDMYQIDRDLPFHFNEVIGSAIAVILSVTFITYITPAFLLFFIPLVCLYIYLQNYFKRTYVDLARLHSMANSPIFSHFSETLDGISTIRAYKSETRFKHHNILLQTGRANVSFLVNGALRWAFIRIEIAGMAVVSLTGVIALLSVTNFSTFTSWGDAAAKASLVGALLNRCVAVPYEVGWCIRMYSDAQNNFSAVERILQFSKLDAEKYQGEETNDEEEEEEDKWPAKGDLSLKDVVMRYNEDSEPVLKGISVNINDCEKVGIVGRTGAGKSSLLSILFRLREYEAGKIIIDGKDIAKMSLSALRNGLGIIPQEPILITGKLRESLDPSGEYEDYEIWKALEHVSMKDSIERLPQKLDTSIAENANNFSAGEKQLLCMARAILRNRKILVIDEATANVDLQTDALIQQTIRREFKNCTVLTIAHRLDTIMDYDKILVMDKGRVVEFDAPENLIKQNNSLFLAMIEKTGAKTAEHLKQLEMNRSNLCE